jgi:hypothetical protein
LSIPREIAALLRPHPAKATIAAAEDLLVSLPPTDRADLEKDLRRQGVFELIAALLPVDIFRAHRKGRIHAAARLLARRAAKVRATEALEQEGIAYVVFKGAHLTPLLYRDPLLRPALDVDILVTPYAREDAIAALLAVGFKPKTNPATASHELNLSDGMAWVDLHWHLLRPGRSRIPIADEIVSGREAAGDGVEPKYWVPNTTWTTVIMLVHNAITDTVNARAIRAVDLQRWIATRSIDWVEVASTTERMGLQAAAWATLRWADCLVGLDLDEMVFSAFEPSWMHRAYLRTWLAADPAKLYRSHPQLVRLGFGLAMHDSPRDALRFAGSFLKTVRERRR